MVLPILLCGWLAGSGLVTFLIQPTIWDCNPHNGLGFLHQSMIKIVPQRITSTGAIPKSRILQMTLVCVKLTENISQDNDGIVCVLCYYMYVHVCVCIPTHIYMWKPLVMSCVLFHSSLPYFMIQSLSLNLELTILARLTS